MRLRVCAVTRPLGYSVERPEHAEPDAPIALVHSERPAASVLIEALGEIRHMQATNTALLARVDSLEAADKARHERIGAILVADGCDCACGHDFQDHDDDCIRCLGCRVEAALSPEVPDASVASEDPRRMRRDPLC